MSAVESHLPSACQAMWVEIDKEVTWLHGRWIIYRQLYGTTPERVALLNESAGTFFNLLQDMLLHDVQLALSKLGDPAGSGSRTNLTLAALQESLSNAGEAGVVNRMQAPLDRFAAACGQIRHRRNKWIAHYDRSTMLNQQVDPRMGPSRAEIEEALEALRNLLNVIANHFADTTVAYEHFVMNADGQALVANLRRAKRYRELVEAGTIPKDDFVNDLSARLNLSHIKEPATPSDQSTSALIDNKIAELGDWRGAALNRMRRLIQEADPEVVEEWKWMGTPVWSHGGIICTGETYKSKVKLTFAKGASLKDPAKLFNSSLDGNVRRAIDISEGEEIDAEAFKELVRAAVALNASSTKAKPRRMK